MSTHKMVAAAVTVEISAQLGLVKKIVHCIA